MRFDYERAATVLVDALYEGDVEAVQRHGVTRKSLYNWRHRLATDQRLAQLFNEKRRQAETEWAPQFVPAIRDAVEFLRRAARELDPADPDAVHAVAGALKILAEIAMTREVLDARLALTSPETYSAY